MFGSFKEAQSLIETLLDEQTHPEAIRVAKLALLRIKIAEDVAIAIFEAKHSPTNITFDDSDLVY